MGFQKINRALGLSFIGVVILTTSTAMTYAKDRFDSVRALIHKELREKNIPSISVAVAKNGKIIWQEGFGWANREKRVKATAHTSYSLASITKMFTTTGLMTLVEQGKINLDAPINDYLGTAKLIAKIGDVKDATVRRVANHTSGLTTNEQFFYGDDIGLVPPMDRTISRYGMIIRTPGEKYQYNNFGYGILDHVIARVSGKSYAQYLQEAVFTPLGMTRSFIDVPSKTSKPFSAERYGIDDNPVPNYGFDSPGAAAMYSSAHDLARFGLSWMGHLQSGQSQILTKESRKEMISKTIEGYGLALEVSQNGGYEVVGHTGSMSGVSTYLTMVPSQGAVIVLLSNNGGVKLNSIREKIFEAILPKWKKKKSKPRSKRPAAPSLSEQASISGLIGEWAGTLHTYEQDLPLKIKVLKSGDVHVKIADQLWSLMNGMKFGKGKMKGKSLSQISTSDTARNSHFTQLELYLRDGKLTGVAQASTGHPGRPAASSLYWVYALSHWVELEKIN